MTRTRNSVAVIVVWAALAMPAAAQQHAVMTLTDPNRPAIIDINLVNGSITIKGANRKDVMIDAQSSRGRGRRDADEPPPAGLRRLTQGGEMEIEQDGNRIRIDAPVSNKVDCVIEVPVKTNVKLETVQGAIVVVGLDGELEIDSVNGPVTLTDVGGSVVAHSVNGKLLATIARPTPDKPMAFTSLNGNVDVTLPATVKANLKLRSDKGDVYTDFDLQTRPLPPPPRDAAERNGRRRITVDTSIYGSVNGGGADYEIRTFNGNVYVRKGK